MAETATQDVVEVKEPSFPFGKKEKQLITDPLMDNNPVTIQVLGICSALAVTTQVFPSLVISVAVVFVCAFSSLATSLLRNNIPTQVRMIVQLGLLWEAHAAVRTLEHQFAMMPLEMYFECAVLGRGVLTMVTFKRLLS